MTFRKRAILGLSCSVLIATVGLQRAEAGRR